MGNTIGPKLSHLVINRTDRLAKINPSDENNEEAIAEFFEICNIYIDALEITIEAAKNIPIAGNINPHKEFE